MRVLFRKAPLELSLGNIILFFREYRSYELLRKLSGPSEISSPTVLGANSIDS